MLWNSSSADHAASLAAEQLVHVLDGWRYASAAFSAYMKNSRASATHFAYYAELRSAISLFAGSGIRINQDDSYYLDENNNKIDIRGNTRTHTLTWNIWSEWIKRKDAVELLTHSVKLISGVELRHFALSASDVMSYALRHWGYDLLQLAKDRDARNAASYVPVVSESLHVMTDAEASLIKKIWSLLLPTEHGVGFDRALINFLVMNAAKSHHEADGDKSIEDYREDIIERASSETGVEHDVIKSLLYESDPDTELFHKATQGSTDIDNVLCRAVFLLRIASLSLAKAVFGPEPAAKWVRNWLRVSGLYEDDEIEPRDLSEDYRIASEEFYTPSTSLPHCLWNDPESNLQASSKLVRPEAFLAWAVEI